MSEEDIQNQEDSEDRGPASAPESPATQSASQPAGKAEPEGDAKPEEEPAPVAGDKPAEPDPAEAAPPAAKPDKPAAAKPSAAKARPKKAAPSKEAPAGEANNQAKVEAYQIGVLVFVILLVLTFGEFLFAVIAPPWWWALVLIALLKAFYVIRDYMHIGKVFNPDQEDH